MSQFHTVLIKTMFQAGEKWQSWVSAQRNVSVLVPAVDRFSSAVQNDVCAEFDITRRANEDDLWHSLEANPAPMIRKHKCDVETQLTVHIHIENRLYSNVDDTFVSS